MPLSALNDQVDRQIVARDAEPGNAQSIIAAEQAVGAAHLGNIA